MSGVLKLTLKAKPNKFTPNPDLKLTTETHPFEYMECFYPKAVRDTEVDNSERYRAWIKSTRQAGAKWP